VAHLDETTHQNVSLVEQTHGAAQVPAERSGQLTEAMGVFTL
jgi:hypothetical protein